MRNVLFLALVTLLIGCKTTDKMMTAPVIEERMLDTLTVSAPKVTEEKIYELDVFRGSAERTVDIIHTALDLSFDWEKQHVLGKAEITVRPYFYDTDMISLDAVGFDIHHIKSNGRDLKYDYDGADIKIDLGRKYSRDNLIILDIHYTAKPEETPAGSSAAITSEKGLFFINPLNTDPDKPQQIWTQGETENNSRWFPTVDKPNERCTQEIKLTVQDKYATLSNGKLMSSTKNADGTRTDYWKQDKPHAPYLFMVGVGEFAVITETWNGKDVMYYVEPEYEADAKAIFNHTPEMLSFFSDKLNYPFPWDKYAQIVVKDFVSGAMENTGAVTFGDFVQNHKKQLVDNDNDLIVAHEMFHHWFGDLVTCESWANLTMNEGFANYSEYLWYEHKYGKDRADHHRQNEIYGYLGSTQRGGAHPLIHYQYEDKEEMFDAHSYNKGGLVLHMLRHYVGDDAFFASLHKYLKDNEYTEVEADELRLAFEDITGKDLIWFFDQWYFSAGHPELYVIYEVDKENNMLNISVEQTQDAEKFPPIFILPTTVAIYDMMGKSTRHDITINQRKQNFSLPIKRDFAWASIDADDVLLAEIINNKTPEIYGHQFLSSPNYREQILALTEVKELATANVLYEEGLKNDYHNIRRKALMELNRDEKYRGQIEEMMRKDAHSNVRAAAIQYLSELTPEASAIPGIVKEMKGLIKNDVSYRPANAALKYIYTIDNAEGIKLTKELSNHKDNAFAGTITDIYIESNDDQYLPLLLEQFDNAKGVEFYFASQKMLPFFKEKTIDTKLKAAEIYLAQSKRDGPPWMKFVAKEGISQLMGSLGDDPADGTKEKFELLLSQLPE